MNASGELQSPAVNDPPKVNFGGKIGAVRTNDGWNEVNGKNSRKDELAKWLKKEEKLKRLQMTEKEPERNVKRRTIRLSKNSRIAIRGVAYQQLEEMISN